MPAVIIMFEMLEVGTFLSNITSNAEKEVQFESLPEYPVN